MRNIARLSDEERYELFRNTADKMKLHDAIVEKDFWVCFTLHDAIVEKDFWVCFTLDYFFHRSPWKKAITFKGRLIEYKTKHPKSKSFRCFFDTFSNMFILIHKLKMSLGDYFFLSLD